MSTVAELLQTKPTGGVYTETFDIDLGRFVEGIEPVTVTGGYVDMPYGTINGVFDLSAGGSIVIEATDPTPGYIFQFSVNGLGTYPFQANLDGAGDLSWYLGAEDGGPITYSATNHRWMRFTWDGEDTATFDVSPNGTTWTTLETAALSGISTVFVDLWGCDLHTAIVDANPVGVALGMGDWRIAVQMLLPIDVTARWGIAKWGESKWNGLQWYDMTEYVRGAEWTRGASSFAGRPEVGVLNLTLDNADRQFSPWNGVSAWNDATIVDDTGTVQPGYFAPGSIVRVVAFSPSGQVEPLTNPNNLLPASDDAFVPQFSGIVESWTDETLGLGKDSSVNVTVIETLSAMAPINDNALLSVEGDDDQPAARIQRLLNAAGWKYGDVIDTYFDVDPFLTSTDYRLQSTDMADNRISELYLTADSVGGVIRSDRSGAPTFYNSPETSVTASAIKRGPDKVKLVSFAPGFSTGASGFFNAPYVADSVNVENDDEPIINDVRLTFVGGTERSDTDSVSEQQYGSRPYSRSDLICKDNDLLDHLIAKTLAARSRKPLRLSSLQLHSQHQAALLPIISLDVHDTVDVELPPLPSHQVYANGNAIDSLTHRLTPLNESEPIWTVDITFGIQSGISNIAI